MAIYTATGTAADAHAWLSAIRGFLATIGWAEDTWSSAGGVSRLHAHAGALYWSLDCRDRTVAEGTGPAVGVCACTGYSAGSAWDAQPGTASAGYANQIDGSGMAYRLFGGSGADGTYCHALIELAAGVWSSLHVGSLIVAGTLTGGAFHDAVTWNQRDNFPYYRYHHLPFAVCDSSAEQSGRVRADLDGAAAPNWLSFQGCLTSAPGAGSLATVDPWLWTQSPNALNARTVLAPIAIYAPRPGGYWSALGEVPGVRACSMELLEPGEVLTLGADEWQAFPARSRSATALGAAAGDASGYLGYAYRRA